MQQILNVLYRFAYLNGTDPFLEPSGCRSNDFANRDERSWQIAMNYSFANLGAPWPEPE